MAAGGTLGVGLPDLINLLVAVWMLLMVTSFGGGSVLWQKILGGAQHILGAGTNIWHKWLI